jgi:hypothetical protein
VGGRIVVSDCHHRHEEDAARGFIATVQHLAA